MRFRWKCKLRRRCDSSVGFTSTNEQWISFLSPRRQAMACCKALWHVSASRCYYTAGSTSTTAILDLWPKQDAASLSLSSLIVSITTLFPAFYCPPSSASWSFDGPLEKPTDYIDDDSGVTVASIGHKRPCRNKLPASTLHTGELHSPPN